MKIFKNFFKILLNKTKNADESFLFTKVVYNEENNFMILLSFSNDYFADVIEFLDASNRTFLRTKYIQSSYEEINDTDDDIIVYDRYYLLISGDDSDYIELYNSLDSINNTLACAIEKDIINNRNMNKYKDLYFYKKNKSIPEYDKRIKVLSNDSEFVMDDINKIKSNLPKCFTAQSLSYFIFIDIDDTSNTIYNYLDGAYNLHIKKHMEIVNKIKDHAISLICDNPTNSVLKNWCGPQYLVNDDDYIVGDLDDKSIDDIFKQEYEKFNAIASDDLQYVDIDEELTREEIYDDDEK